MALKDALNREALNSHLSHKTLSLIVSKETKFHTEQTQAEMQI